MFTYLSEGQRERVSFHVAVNWPSVEKTSDNMYCRNLVTRSERRFHTFNGDYVLAM